MSLFEYDRGDIYQQIADLQHQDANAVNDEKIVQVYEEQCDEDIKKFIALFDKNNKVAKSIRRAYYNEYEKSVEELQKDMVNGKQHEKERSFYTSRYHKYEL